MHETVYCRVYVAGLSCPQPLYLTSITLQPLHTHTHTHTAPLTPPLFFTLLLLLHSLPLLPSHLPPHLFSSVPSTSRNVHPVTCSSWSHFSPSLRFLFPLTCPNRSLPHHTCPLIPHNVLPASPLPNSSYFFPLISLTIPSLLLLHLLFFSFFLLLFFFIKRKI